MERPTDSNIVTCLPLKRKKSNREEKNLKKAKKRRGRQKKLFLRQTLTEIPMLVNKDVFRAHGDPAPLTGLRAPQVPDPA